MTVPYSKIRSALRKLWLYSPERKEVKDRSRVKRGWYQCEVCMGIVDKVDIDHIDAPGPTPGSRNARESLTWDIFMNRLFVPASKMQALCKTCHKEKTLQERAAMKAERQTLKEKKNGR